MRGPTSRQTARMAPGGASCGRRRGLCVLPPCLTALGGILLFVLADKLFEVLMPLGSMGKL